MRDNHTESYIPNEEMEYFLLLGDLQIAFFCIYLLGMLVLSVLNFKYWYRLLRRRKESIDEY